MSDQEELFAPELPKAWQGGDRPMPGGVRLSDPETSHVAAAVIAPKAGTWRARVLDRLVGAGALGMTDFELEGSFPEARTQTIRTRRSELVKAAFVQDSGTRRRTDAGLEAIVWVVTPAGRQAQRR